MDVFLSMFSACVYNRVYKQPFSFSDCNDLLFIVLLGAISHVRPVSEIQIIVIVFVKEAEETNVLPMFFSFFRPRLLPFFI